MSTSNKSKSNKPNKHIRPKKVSKKLNTKSSKINNKKRKTVCLNMIVKNEAHIITETLDTIKKYIDCWVICDTGSTELIV